MIEKKIGILGAGSWATALAITLARKGLKTVLWARRADLAEEINIKRTNERYLKGVSLPSNLNCTTDLEMAVSNVDFILSVVPSHAFRNTIKQVLPMTKKDSLIINAAKGLEEDSLKRLSKVFEEEVISNNAQNRYVMLSGPSHAEEVGRGMPAAVVVASEDLKSAEKAREMLASETFRVYTNTDVAGVELGGALKNIIALGTGIADGLGYGDNTKAALMTRGLAEITRLGSKMGANPLTFAGLAGVGDLIVTCTSIHSRNRRVGIEIGKGKSLSNAISSVHMVVEGVKTTKAAHQIGNLLEVELPITQQTYQVLFGDLSPEKAVKNLMCRSFKAEIENLSIS